MNGKGLKQEKAPAVGGAWRPHADGSRGGDAGRSDPGRLSVMGDIQGNESILATDLLTNDRDRVRTEGKDWECCSIASSDTN